MPDPSPWTFGWTQLLTIGGLAIAFQGVRTFGRWRREKIEEKRIEVAIDALAAAYKSKHVFEYVRGRLLRGYEYSDMPEIAGETERERSRRGNFFAVWRRLDRNKDFFDHVWELQPKFMAIFGRETEDIFLLLHTARRDIEVACEMLQEMKEPEPGLSEDRKLWVQLRRDIWSSAGGPAKEEDKVGTKLEEFRTQIEVLCRPLIDRELGGATREATMAAFAKWWRGS
jgi:hypothetical protein